MHFIILLFYCIIIVLIFRLENSKNKINFYHFNSKKLIWKLNKNSSKLKLFN
jgi:hypothetical protein